MGFCPLLSLSAVNFFRHLDSYLCVIFSAVQSTFLFLQDPRAFRRLANVESLISSSCSGFYSISSLPPEEAIHIMSLVRSATPLLRTLGSPHLLAPRGREVAFLSSTSGTRTWTRFFRGSPPTQSQDDPSNKVNNLLFAFVFFFAQREASIKK